MNGIGIIFPAMQIKTALMYGIFKRAAAISPPLSSKIGIIEIIKAPASLGSQLRFVVNQIINAYVIL